MGSALYYATCLYSLLATIDQKKLLRIANDYYKRAAGPSARIPSPELNLISAELSNSLTPILPTDITPLPFQIPNLLKKLNN